ncbi:hypothetical protein [Micromonospora arida]
MTDTAPAKKIPAKKATTAKGPVPTERGRLNHENCAHPRTPKGRAGCRAEQAKKAAETK